MSNIVSSYVDALRKIESTINDGQLKILLGHFSAPGMALSVKRMAEIAGYEGARSGSLQYGKLARNISEAMGVTPPTGDLISMIAEWDGNAKNSNGHGQWIMYDEVATALKVLGWVNAIGSNQEQKDILMPKGILKPTKTVVPTIQFNRDDAVKSWVLDNSAGHCDCCGQKAPFQSNDGTPYLEVHHVRQLSELGSDRPENAVAVCPNCHRELHHGKNKNALVENLYARITRLKRE